MYIAVMFLIHSKTAADIKPCFKRLALYFALSATFTVGEQVVEQVEAGKQTESAKVDLLNLAPRKPDWDLKRDCAARMEKLQRRTQRAVAQIVRKYSLLLRVCCEVCCHEGGSAWAPGLAWLMSYVLLFVNTLCLEMA